jgi:hypothetical protein
MLTNKIVSGELRTILGFILENIKGYHTPRLYLLVILKASKYTKRKVFFVMLTYILINSVSRKLSSQNAQELKLGTHPKQLIYIKEV